MIDGKFEIEAGAEGEIVSQNIRHMVAGGHGHEMLEIECKMGANGLFAAVIPFVSGAPGRYAIRVGTGGDAPGQTFRVTIFAFLGQLTDVQFSTSLQQSGIQSANIAPTAMASGFVPCGRMRVVVDQSGAANAGKKFWLAMNFGET